MVRGQKGKGRMGFGPKWFMDNMARGLVVSGQSDKGPNSRGQTSKGQKW